MLGKLRKSLDRVFNAPFIPLFARIGITPNALTIIGFLLNVVVGGLLATGYLFLGGFLILFSGWFDMLDGTLARAVGKSSKFGALLDSTLDRLSEAALFLGLLIFYLDRDATLEIVLVFVAIVGSMMVSYIRARSESLGDVGAEVGLFARPERIVILALGLILTRFSIEVLVAALWILAVGTMLTSLRRLLHGWRQLKDATSS